MDNTKKPVFIYSQALEKYSYPPDSMFDTRRAAKTRELLISLGLLEGKCGRESAPVPATKSELKNFHTAKYLEALQQAAIGKITPEARSMGLGTMVISLHENGKTLWPGTGFENETGDGPGKGFTVNVPLPIGICDAAYIEVFTEIVIPLIKAYDPDIFVLQTGMDALAADPLAHLELTNNAHAEIIDRLLRFNKPLLATGGGGYHFDNTVRGWALAWKIMCGVGDESDIAFGMGGVMLQSTEWSGGLRDRVLPMDEQHCEAVETAIRATIRSLTRNVFKYHGI
jgi:acetoin utilization deacetylase AcuC-like enzyme